MAQKKGQPELKLAESLIMTDGGEWNTLSHAVKPWRTRGQIFSNSQPLSVWKTSEMKLSVGSRLSVISQTDRISEKVLKSLSTSTSVYSTVILQKLCTINTHNNRNKPYWTQQEETKTLFWHCSEWDSYKEIFCMLKCSDFKLESTKPKDSHSFHKVV